MIFGARLYLAAGVAAMVLTAGGVIWTQARTVASLRADLRECRAAADTMERINDAISDPRTPDSIIERLRDLAK